MSGNQKTLGIIGVVCGGVAVFLGFWSSTIVMGIIGIAAGIVGLILSNKAKQGFAAAGESSPLPKIGLILSIIGLALSVILTISCGICYCVSYSASQDPAVQSALESAISSAIVQ